MTDSDIEGLWNETLNQLKNDYGKVIFNGWFEDMKLLRAQYDENTKTGSIIASVSSTFRRDRIKSNYLHSINSKLKTISGKEITLEMEIIEKTTNKTENTTENSHEDLIDTSQQIKKEEIITEKKYKPRSQHPQIRDDYTFERYIETEHNRYARSAAVAISTNPGKVYNPFLIFGGTGLGKTHLMQAIGNYVHEYSTNEVIYITSENFLNEYVQSIKEGKMNLFKNKFRFTDVLLIDDIEFFEGKDRVQEELFHTFNALLDAKKQLVFTCDRPVSELKKLNERLHSRFELCLKVDLQPPRYEERCAILKSIAEIRKADVPIEVIEIISKNISSNVRDLISALNDLIGYAEIIHGPITLEFAQHRLKSTFNTSRIANLNMDNIIRVTAEYFGLTPNDLKGKKRTQNIVFARHLAMYIGDKITGYSSTEIGQDFGGRDHSTVIYSIEKIKAKLLTDPSLEATLENIGRLIKEFSAKY